MRPADRWSTAPEPEVRNAVWLIRLRARIACGEASEAIRASKKAPCCPRPRATAAHGGRSRSAMRRIRLIEDDDRGGRPSGSPQRLTDRAGGDAAPPENS